MRRFWRPTLIDAESRALGLYRVNITRRLSKTLISCQIFFSVLHCSVNPAEYAAKQPRPIAMP